jgi:acyl-CoA reductase-like NAD-dependent aldehyde dehydrogenase
MSEIVRDRFINGRWTAAHGSMLEVFNPAHPDRVVSRWTTSSQADVDEALQAASDAFQGWSRVPVFERYTALTNFAAAIEAKLQDIAQAITLEQGKPLAEARAETGKALQEARFAFTQCLQPSGAAPMGARPGFRDLVIRRPRGVIAAVTPWNFPILTPMRKIAPALAWGNCIVIKPSEFTPGAVALIADAAAQTLPAGVLQVVNGAAETARALIGSPRVQGVTFTGSVATGRKVYAAAAESLAELSLELGGKNAAVVHDCDDIDAVASAIMGAAMQCAGQRCTAISRVIVHESLRTPLVKALVNIAEAAVLGDGMLPGMTMGPLTTAAQLHKVEQMVAEGLQAGALLRTGGRRVQPDNARAGRFYAPTLLDEVPASSSVAREEIFGPVLSILGYDSLEQAIGLVNDVPHGLTSSFFSNDYRAVRNFMEQAKTGMLHVNHGTVPDSHMPFGGIGQSGVGAYSVGPSAQSFYTTEHAVYLP